MEFSETCFKKCSKVRRVLRADKESGLLLLDQIDKAEDVFGLKSIEMIREIASTAFRPEYGAGYSSHCDGVPAGALNLSALPEGVNLLEVEDEVIEAAVVCGRHAAPGQP